ncbi:MAG: RIP metalloprotease RseP [Dysgonamonadaceae bacterium]|jgi:regulator of sigma E protease|nr:RIP metalloprotease RseP [Dysgonamonadaceae bacterium]
MDIIVIRTVQLVLSLSILVIIHECGHFLFARLFKVRVEKFYLFFNPWFSLFKYKPKKSETEYGIGWLPLGGYVKISGMIDESMDREAMAQPPKPWEFRTKSATQRLLIMLGGVLMNFLLAFFLFAMLVFAFGEEYIPVKNVKMGFSYNELFIGAGFRNGDIPVAADNKSLSDIDIRRDVNELFNLLEAKEVQVLRDGQLVNITMPEGFVNKNINEKSHINYRYPFVIKTVTNGSPASAANLEAGDSIVGVNDRSDMFAHDVINALSEYKGKEIVLNLYRNGELKNVSITPTAAGKIGVGFLQPEEIYETVKKHYNFFSAFPAGIRIGIETTAGYLKGLKYLFTKEGMENVGGFGSIASIFPGKWIWSAFWSMTAFLSIILGVMNLLPIPGLDGGHVMFVLYEMITGRKPSDKFMEYAQTVGMILLIALILYANGMDILRAIGK